MGSACRRNVFILLVLAIMAMNPSISTSSEDGKEHLHSFEFYKTWHVHAVNNMSHNKLLYVHCKSRENDLGIHNLTVGNEFSWKFKPQVFGKTLFWCYMACDRDYVHATFDVYWENEHLAYRCNWKNCYWIAKDSGIYLKNIPENYDEFRYKWEPGFSS